MAIVCPDCGVTTRDPGMALLARSGRLGRCTGCARPRLVACSVLPLIGVPAVAAVCTATALADAGPTAPRGTMPAPDEFERLRCAAVRRRPDLSAMLLVPSPPLVPQVIDATATIAPRATPNLRAPPVPRHRTRPRGDRPWARFLPAITALQLAAVAAVLLARVEVVRVMPEAASLFRMIGLPVNLRGLVFAGLGTRTERPDGVAVLIVEGRIESDSRSAVAVPPLRFALRDAAGAELYAWTAPPDAATLGPGESLPFQARMISPPPSGNDVLVRFAHPSDG
jgi:hypothetical protein